MKECQYVKNTHRIEEVDVEDDDDFEEDEEDAVEKTTWKVSNLAKLMCSMRMTANE